ncbi:MAG: hypothetical protein HC871_10500 [Rhizobiales bacterium]|nr:hypothetical protein [Hyphomicrobiales bacterium]
MAKLVETSSEPLAENFAGIGIFPDMVDNALQGVTLHDTQERLYVNRAWAPCMA